MIKAVFRLREAATAALLLILLFTASTLAAAESGPVQAEEHQSPTLQMATGSLLPAGGHTKNDAHADTHAAVHEPGMFDIDVVVLVSQTINFFILLFLLQRFLFVPIGNVIDERRKNLGRVKLLTEAEHQKALELKLEYEKHIENIQEELYQIRQHAILEGNNRREEIIEEARKKAEEIIENGEMEIFMERQTAWARLREEVVQLTLMAAEKVVEDSLDDKLHRKLIEATIEKLANDLPDHKNT